MLDLRKSILSSHSIITVLYILGDDVFYSRRHHDTPFVDFHPWVGRSLPTLHLNFSFCFTQYFYLTDIIISSLYFHLQNLIMAQFFILCLHPNVCMCISISLYIHIYINTQIHSFCEFHEEIFVFTHLTFFWDKCKSIYSCEENTERYPISFTQFPPIVAFSKIVV